MRLVLISPERITIEKSLRLDFSATNNEAKYEALLEGMSMVQKLGKKAIDMFSNSRLIVSQVNEEYEVRDKRMQEYLDKAKCLRSNFDSFSLLHIPRNGITHVDSLATLATSSSQSLSQVILVEDLYKPTATKGDVVHVHHVRVGPSWMDLLILFRKKDTLLDDKTEADMIRRNELLDSSYLRTKSC